MKAKDFLKQLQKLDALIANKLVERDQWFAMATSTTAASAPETGIRVQSSGSKQQMANATSAYIDIERDIDACIDRLYDEKKKVLAVIEQLDVIEYDILHKVYVGVMKKTKQGNKRYYYTLDDVAEHFGKSRSWADTKHGVALKHVQNIIDNFEKL